MEVSSNIIIHLVTEFSLCIAVCFIIVNEVWFTLTDCSYPFLPFIVPHCTWWIEQLYFSILFVSQCLLFHTSVYPVMYEVSRAWFGCIYFIKNIYIFIFLFYFDLMLLQKFPQVGSILTVYSVLAFSSYCCKCGMFSLNVLLD